ncbi:copper resistance protein CopC [Peribacillus sp. NPDC097675]|uniref:copper resistance protein CopC n=1 Tax=Peribacillus sp. NPDC097675 TaxID=3390618 RepID=UPI003D028EE1
MKNSIWLFVSILALFIFPITVFGHATVISSNPSPNESLDTIPEKISIQFSEDIQSSFYSLKVISKNKNEIPLQDIQVSEKTLEATWSSSLDEGSYIIKWRVVSSDGHPIEGTIPFQYGKSHTPSDQVNAEEEAGFPSSVQVFLQSIQYLCFAALTGVPFFYLSLSKSPIPNQICRRVRRYIWLSYFGLAISILLSLPLKVTIDAQVGWQHAFNGTYLSEVLQSTQFGVIWLIEMMLLLVLFVAIFFMIRNQLNKLSLMLPLVFVSSMMVCKACIGHTTDTSNQYWAVSMDFLHILAMSLWLGGLLAILVILPKSYNPKVADDNKTFYWLVIQKFSSWAILFVSVLIVTGLYSSFQHVSTLYSLLHTTYGQLLLSKIGLMLIMIGLGALHLVRGKRKTKKKLGLTTGIEFSVGIIVLIIAALLTNVQTAKSSPGPIEQTEITENNVQVTLSVTPNKTGDNYIQVELKKDKSIPYTNIEQLTLTMESLDGDVGKIKLQLQEGNEGLFKSKSIIPMSGKWKVHVHGLTKDLSSIDADFLILVGNS